MLGGYDKSRIEPGTTATFELSGPTSPPAEMMVQVHDVRLKWNNGISTTFIESFPAILDSTYPHLYLPMKLCDWFEDKFEVAFDPQTEIYGYIKDHTFPSTTIDNIAFSLKDVAGSEVKSRIEFPVDAFYTNISWHWYSTIEARILPIRRAQGDIAILGRTFFKEAYVSANFDMDVLAFNVSQAAFPKERVADIQTIHSTPVLVTRDGVSSPSSDLSAGQISGIVIGISAAVSFLVFAVLISTAMATPDSEKAGKAETDEDFWSYIWPAATYGGAPSRATAA